MRRTVAPQRAKREGPKSRERLVGMSRFRRELDGRVRDCVDHGPLLITHRGAPLLVAMSLDDYCAMVRAQDH